MALVITYTRLDHKQDEIEVRWARVLDGVNKADGMAHRHVVTRGLAARLGDGRSHVKMM